MNEPPSFEDFRKEVLTKARAAGLTLEPDGEWAPVLLLDTAVGLEIVALDRLQTEHAEQKLIPPMITKRRARLACRVQGAWGLHGVEHVQRVLLGGTPPSEHPDRRELVVVIIASATRVESFKAEVTRVPARAPLLGMWERQREQQSVIADWMQLALQVADRQN